MSIDLVSKRSLFLNVAHFFDHMFMLIYATAVITIALEFKTGYGQLVALSAPSFILFGGMALPFGWLGDKIGRHTLITIFYIGIGFSSILTGLSEGYWQIAFGLSAIGVFAAIYHPVGIPMLVQGIKKPGKVLGINGVFGNMGVAAAPLIVGIIGNVADWRWAFIAPGIISVIIGILFWKTVKKDTPDKSATTREAQKTDPMVSGWKHVLSVIAGVSLIGGLIFNSTTISLPKLFEERLDQISTNAWDFTIMASLVYAIASMAQIAAGYAVDKFSAKRLMLCLVGAQGIVFVLVSHSQGYFLFGLSLLGMCFVFGQIPIIDTILTRYVPDSYRGRIFSLKYLLNLGVGAMAVPMIAYLHGSGAGFTVLFQVLSISAFLVFMFAATLPKQSKKKMSLT